MKNFIFILFFVFAGVYGHSTNKENSRNEKEKNVLEKCKDGDFIFVSSDLSAFDEAVSNVTKKEGNLNFSHIGLVHRTDSGIFVVEAIAKGVSYTPADTFVRRNSRSTIKIARLKTDYQKYISEAIAKTLQLVGKEYDFAFDLENDAYYCSELLYLAFAETSGDKHFFELSPMTFIDKTTNEYHLYWVVYFAERDMDIPEGKPGLNPNGMSLSDKLEWIDVQPD